MNRRGFLRLLGGTVAAAVTAPLIMPRTALALPTTAPLYVPPQHLDYGVPQLRLVTATALPCEHEPYCGCGSRPPLIPEPPRITGTIPMLLLEGQFMMELGGRLPAGSQVMVDRETAERWMDYRVAVPGPGAPDNLEARSARREAEQAYRRDGTRYGNPLPSWSAPVNGAVLYETVAEADMSRYLREMLRA